MKRLLLLAGTEEARHIAGALAREADLRVIASLAGATRAPRPLGVPTRIGGFGGEAGMRAYLEEQRIDAVLDATHPFAVEISRRAHRVCAALGLPYMLFLRPPWMPDPGDRWVFLNTEDEAAEHIPEGATVFLATGGKSVPRWRALEGRRVYLRLAERPATPFPFAEGGYLVGPPARSASAERQLMERLGVDWLVAKNAGGSAGRAKLDAARQLGLPVAMLRRPLQPEAPRVTTISAALGWVRSRE
jgi:precorrin-6A/cobalt-precorrin-6A reductase